MLGSHLLLSRFARLPAGFFVMMRKWLVSHFWRTPTSSAKMYLATELLTFMKHKGGCPGFRHFTASESAQSQQSTCKQIFWKRWNHPNDRVSSCIPQCLLFISHTESFLQTRLMQFVPLFVATDRCSHYTSPSYLCSGIQFQFLQTSCGVQGPSRGLQAAAESKDRREPHLARRPWTEKCRRQDSKTAAAAGHRGPAGKSHSTYLIKYQVTSKSGHWPEHLFGSCTLMHKEWTRLVIEWCTMLQQQQLFFCSDKLRLICTAQICEK